ncbi:MAG: response regulator [Elusimicrobiota bacterium]|nr:response regulator [Elusimicrobiota bacterium]
MKTFIDKRKKILIADDNAQMGRLLKRVFSMDSWDVALADNGNTALKLAAKHQPDIIILDINMPGKTGNEVLQKLRETACMSTTPIIMLTGLNETSEKVNSFNKGADDYITKPFVADELKMQVNAIYNRNKKDLHSNPLTKLPGAPAIAEEVTKKLSEGEKLSYMYIDIDNFKSYNDAYGHINGDEAIKSLAQILESVKQEFPLEDVFIGHIGGDDFTLIAKADNAERIASYIAVKFDKNASRLYKTEDRKAGFIQARTRKGDKKRFPIITISIAIATNEYIQFYHHAQLADTVSEIKKHLKLNKHRGKSSFMKDRRKK